MKYVKTFNSILESGFYNSANREKIVSHLQTKLDYISGKSEQDMNLQSLVYNFVMRSTGKENKELENFVNKVKGTYQSMIAQYLEQEPNRVLKFYPNPDKENMVWLEAKLNRTHSKQDKTYNYYLTFTQTEENLLKFFRALPKLIRTFFEYCKENKEFECGFKFGADASYFTTEKDHLKFYYYNPKKKDKLMELVKEWIKDNEISVEDRPYSHAIDGKDAKGKKTSFGDLAATEISNNLEKLMVQHKDKFTADQYYDWLITYMENAKYNIVEK